MKLQSTWARPGVLHRLRKMECRELALFCDIGVKPSGESDDDVTGHEQHTLEPICTLLAVLCRHLDSRFVLTRFTILDKVVDKQYGNEQCSNLEIVEVEGHAGLV